MSLVHDVIVKLNLIDPFPFALVEGAAEFAAIDGVPVQTPAAYVFIKEEAAGENERATGPVMQRVEADLAIVLISANVADATGAAAGADIEALKAQVLAALVGFVPASSEGDALEFVGSRILRFRAGTAWAELLFSAVYYIEEQP